MKCSIPEIAWHNRDPVLSVDFQPTQTQKEIVRLATGGCDTHVVIWYVKTDDAGSVSIEVAADLVHHQKAVNVVRWSPSGELLASGDDESAIIIWKQKTDIDPPQLFESNDEQDRETWNVYKILRGHVEDIYDISWCPLGKLLISGSVDNTAILWDVHKGSRVGMLHHKGFVQGVAWDPSNQYAATMSSDRVFRVFDVNSKKVVARGFKAVLPLPVLHPHRGQTLRLFHDDTLQSFFRRLDFSPDGELIAVPTGLIEGDQSRGLKNVNATYIYSRYSLQVPICILPCGESPALAVRWSPVKYSPRKDGPPPLINLPNPVRMILAVGTNDSISVYDTQQSTPLAIVLNPQYARLTDLTWSSDGNILIVSSSDGYCSIITFTDNELGDVLCNKELSQSSKNDEIVAMDVDTPVNNENNKNTQENAEKTKESHSTPGKVDEVIKTPKGKSPKVKSESGKKKARIIADMLGNDAGLQLNTPEKEKDSQNIASKIEEAVMKTPKYKSPKAKTSSGKKKDKAVENNPAGIIAIDEAAMEAWSQDGFMSKVKSPPAAKPPSQVVIDDPTQDMHLLYEESEDTEKSGRNISTAADKIIPEIVLSKPEERNISEAEAVKSLPKNEPAASSVLSPKPVQKTPRRVNFITLSGPKETDVKKSPPKNEPATSSVISPMPLQKTPRRVNFITLSSPKSKKKLL